MSISAKIILLRAITIVWGIALGSFLGVMVLGTILRIILHLLFEWGESGPDWLKYLFLTMYGITIVSTCYLSLNWTNSYMRRNGFIQR